MKKRLQQLRNEEGLTLVELLAVIVILAIIAVVAFVMIGTIIENSREDGQIANATQLIASTKLFEAAGEIETAPGTFTFAELNDGGYIDAIYDSWDKEAPTTAPVVTKDDTATPPEYSVTLESNDAANCDIDATEAELAEGRSVVCP